MTNEDRTNDTDHNALRLGQQQRLTFQQRADLADEVRQAEYHRAYQEQQRRRACPECGD